MLRVLHTYVMLCHGRLAAEQKQSVTAYIGTHEKKEGGSGALADRWGLSLEEVRLFRKALDEQ